MIPTIISIIIIMNIVTTITTIGTILFDDVGSKGENNYTNILCILQENVYNTMDINLMEIICKYIKWISKFHIINCYN